MKPESDSPTTWFCLLEDAIRRGDREREMEARAELARLGVYVTIDMRSQLARTALSGRKDGRL